MYLYSTSFSVQIKVEMLNNHSDVLLKNLNDWFLKMCIIEACIFKQVILMFNKLSNLRVSQLQKEIQLIYNK